MALKPRYKRRIFWGILSFIAIIVLATVFVPPLITLNNLKPRIQSAISATGFDAKINGDIDFSLIGGLNIAAHDIDIGNGNIETALFRIPLAYIFNLENAPLGDKITIRGGGINVARLVPPMIDNQLDMHNFTVNFKNKDYHIIDGKLDGGRFAGNIRTDQHKYEIAAFGDEFNVKNRNNNLDITGRLYSDGSANGTMSIDTYDVNRFFDFDDPKISRRIKLKMNFDWDGEYGFKFSDITGDNFAGNIELYGDGRRDIELSATGLVFDMTFLLSGTEIFQNTKLNLDLYGQLSLADKKYNHIKVDAVGTSDSIEINQIIADDVIIDGGVITADTVNDMQIRTPNIFCLFNGTPKNWECTDFTYNDMTGNLSVDNNVFAIFIQSGLKMPNDLPLNDVKILGDTGRINFVFSDVGGHIDIDGDKMTPVYNFVRGKAFDWLGYDIKILPENFANDAGDFIMDDDVLSFTPYSGRWSIKIQNNSFIMRGVNIRDLFGGIDTRFMNDAEYAISGTLSGDNISDLKIETSGHIFTGALSGGNITLTTDLLNLDSFTNQWYVDNYEEQQFLSQDPIIILFGLDVNISMSAARLIFNGYEFENFVYSKQDSRQTFSISDNLLATLRATRDRYDIVLQLNRFAVRDKLLNAQMPFNISNTIITGDARMTTRGKIAYDIYQNLNGDIDITFDGGILDGLGVDEFYAAAPDITKINAEFVLANALDGGASVIKKMRIIGNYNGGDFVTSTPMTLSLRHADATGMFRISNGAMIGDINLTLRGTSPAPAPIALGISADGRRGYSLSQIMIDFDPDFMRDFVRTHDKF